MTTHPFRFGLSVHRIASARAWRDTARRAEDLGYGSLVVADHLNDQVAPLPALAAAAAVTSTIRLGTLVLCNDLRHPAVLAKEIATVDLLSDGRFEWGIGAGWLPSDYETSGIPFDPPAVRVSRLIESVGVVTRLLAGETVEHAGEHHTITGLRGTPGPVQSPVPLLVGGGQPRLLRFAAATAQIIGVAPDIRSRQYGPFPPSRTVREAMDRQVVIIAEAAAGRSDAPELNVTMMPVGITDRVAERAAELATPLGLTPDEVLASPHVLLGSVDAVCDQLQERRERWGLSYWVFPSGVVDQMAPVVARLAGR